MANNSTISPSGSNGYALVGNIISYSSSNGEAIRYSIRVVILYGFIKGIWMVAL